MKRCATLQIIKEMQIKSTVSYHLPLVRLAHLLSQKQEIRSAGEDVEEKGLTLVPSWWECRLVQPMDSNIEYPQKLK